MSVQSESGRIDYSKSDHAPNHFQRSMSEVKGRTEDTNIRERLSIDNPKGWLYKGNPTGLGKVSE